MHLRLKLKILILEKVARHLVAEDVIVQALTLLTDVLWAHFQNFQVQGTWVLGREGSSNVALHPLVKGSEAGCQVVSQAATSGRSLLEAHTLRSSLMRGNNLIIDVLGVLTDVTLVIWHHHLLLLLLWHLLVAILNISSGCSLPRLAPDTGWVLWHGIVLVQGACTGFGTSWAEGF